jgi:VanZ family protein
MRFIIQPMNQTLDYALIRRGMVVAAHPIFRRAIALAFTLIATVLLVQSSSEPILGPAAPPGAPDLKREIILTIGHIVVFSSLVVLWWWALLPNLPARRALFVSVGFALIYGLITELAQSLVPDRSGSLYDVAVNWGATSLTALYILRLRRSGR